MRAGSQRTILLFALFLMACAAVLFCVAFESTPLEPYRVTSTGQSEAALSAPAASVLSEEKVNINTAGLEELMQLPGIGEKRAQAILDWREEHGPFSYVEDLIQVPGIGEGILEGLMDQAIAGGETNAEDTGSG